MYNKGNKRNDKDGKRTFVKTTAARKSSAADRGKSTRTGSKSNSGNQRLSSRVSNGEGTSSNRKQNSFSNKPFTRKASSNRESRSSDKRHTINLDKPFARKTSSDRESRSSDRKRTNNLDKPFTRKTSSDRESRSSDRKRTNNLDKPFARKASPEKSSRLIDRKRTSGSGRALSTTNTSRIDHEPKVKSRSGRGPSKTDLIFDRKKARKEESVQEGNIRLNRYIANAGVCSRREADELIGAGLVTVNGKVITEMGYQVKSADDVRYNGERLSREKKVYLLLNKPKDAITTFDDPEGRRTVMELFGKELGERVYPVGRLDRNTTGVLIFTNDGDLAQRLMHPKYEMKKVYKATLNKNFKGEDIWQLTNGVELEDGFIKPDAVAIPDPKNKNEVGIEIHSGKNRIIHRMFEHLGYKVDKLDRALYAGLTKGKLKRGEWRELTEKEVNALKRLVRLG